MIPNVNELLKILKESENDMKYNRVAHYHNPAVSDASH